MNTGREHGRLVSGRPTRSSAPPVPGTVLFRNQWQDGGGRSDFRRTTANNIAPSRRRRRRRLRRSRSSRPAVCTSVRSVRYLVATIRPRNVYLAGLSIRPSYYTMSVSVSLSVCQARARGQHLHG